jgi:DNA invertase Pin-like site-specific DNA recombinase
MSRRFREKTTPVGAAHEIKKAVIYIRISTKEQEAGYSLDAQLSELRKHAARHDITVVETIIEVFTASRPGRMKFDAMVNFFRKEMKKPTGRRVDNILTEKSDRLFRNHHDKETLLELGVTMHLVKERLVVNKDSRSDALYMLDQHVSSASRYSRNLGEEAAKGMAEKAAEGIYPSNAPFGYLNVTKPDGRKVIEPDPICSPIVTKMFTEYAGGRQSLQSLVDIVNDELEAAGANRRVVKSTIAGILSNPIYYGKFIWKGELCQGTHDPLVTEDVFNQVNGVASTKNTHKRQCRRHSWLFQGMLFCGYCRCAMVAEKRKEKYIYYHCTGNKDRECLNKRKNVSQEVIEKQYIEALASIVFDDSKLEQYTGLVAGRQVEEKEGHKQRLAQLTAKLATTENRRTELLMRRLDGKIEEERYQQVDASLDDEISRLREQIGTLTGGANMFIERPAQLRQLSQEMLPLYARQTDQEKRRLLQYVFGDSSWRDGTLSPTFRRPFDVLVSNHQD